MLDERQLSPGESATLAGLLLDGGSDPLPQWQYERAEFGAALAARTSIAGTAFDGRHRRMMPLVDVTRLLRVIDGRGVDGNFCIALLAILVVLIAVLWRFDRLHYMYRSFEAWNIFSDLLDGIGGIVELFGGESLE